eukprot:CAMPEP_0196773808 /NCGR_PEP_ID=MMETSP1104-20130614/2994_1 /TAXON_ID=33652 /ORGANISM="Cafeteria sp., Strain Caron Lab Isolate" /LENGTH=235 /DNA_ID=CAMNT_0042143959 /DNA_START=30 /DNA_END=737 /DNA_ORIENTATION=-
MDRLSRAFSSHTDYSALFKFQDITPAVQSHLSAVYAGLSLAVVSAAAGVYVHMLTYAGGLLSNLLGFGVMFWLAFDPVKALTPKRLALLAAFGFLHGLGLGGLVEVALDIDPSIVMTAFLGTVVIFGSFSLAALYAKRRSALYLGALLSSAVGVMCLISLFNLFFRSEMAFNVILYGGLIVFCGYVMFDTQLIVEKASAGDQDVAWHALELFIDFAAIFVRLLIILSKNSKKERK